VNEGVQERMRLSVTKSSCVTTVLCIAAVLCALAPATTYGKKGKPGPGELSINLAPSQRSRSLNYPWDGQLERGYLLRESKLVRHLPQDVASRRFYGTWQLAQLLERGAQRVSLRWRGARLTIGELSSRRGGDIDGHRSHESGRDADVGFFMKKNGQPYASTSFIPFDSNGRGLAPNGSVRFDTARNWELVSKLVDDRDARVQYIFVARGLRALLLREAVARKVSPAIIARASSVLVQPAHGNPHRSHFHVRIYCPPTDRPLCRDVAPYWPWYPGNPVIDANVVSKTPLSPVL
jgi:penicillin-insensitive murein endopeptidase